MARKIIKKGIRIDNEVSEEVQKYICLGQLITSDNETSKEIGRRVTAGWQRLDSTKMGKSNPIMFKETDNR